MTTVPFKPTAIIRRMNPGSDKELTLVATRMKDTLVEVLGEEKGGNMYTMEWLQQRVRQHYNGEYIAQILVSEKRNGDITGHIILRQETDENEEDIGLISTLYVEPESRKKSIATQLIAHGEKWIAEQGLKKAVTHTADTNTVLIQLLEKNGYSIVGKDKKKDMIILEKSL
jgi:ribosomal protein S18 acetylase RimI-like enzyme